jgi:hypothetical protein
VKLDDEKKDLNTKLTTITDGAEVKRIRERLAALGEEIAAIEHEWLEASGDI